MLLEYSIWSWSYLHSSAVIDCDPPEQLGQEREERGPHEHQELDERGLRMVKGERLNLWKKTDESKSRLVWLQNSLSKMFKHIERR